MGRAGQKVLKDEDALGDRVSVGLLARAFPRATVEAVIEASGAREQRTRIEEPDFFRTVNLLGFMLPGFVGTSSGRLHSE